MRNRLRLLWRFITAPFRLIFWIVRTLLGWLGTLLGEIKGLFAEDPEDSDVVEALTKAVQDPGGLLDHLNDLRKHLFRGLVVLAITTTISFAFAEDILDFLARPVNGLDRLEAIGVTESVGVFMRVSLLTGFTAALPYIVLEMLLFAAPGLKRKERFTGLVAIPLITVLFLGGMAFAYFVVLGPALNFLLNFIFNTTPRPSEYYPFVTGMMFWFGIAFEFPLVIYVVVAMGLVRANVLLEQSRLAVVIMAVLAAAITPTVDPINMLLVWGPLVGLYFLGVGLAFIAQRGRDRRLKAA